MTESSQSNSSESIDRDDRRSSVRVRSRLPCAVEPIDASEIPKLEARILDAAVLESDAVMHDAVDWRDHSDELSNEMVFMLNEVRALRQQVTEVQRLIERHNEVELQHRWVELNVRGLWLPAEDGGQHWEVDEFASVRVQIPSIQTPEILAVARVVRIDEADERRGTAFEFCSISKPHQRAISSYALRRERQEARSERLDLDF